jgi:hypothetical protein
MSELPFYPHLTLFYMGVPDDEKPTQEAQHKRLLKLQAEREYDTFRDIRSKSPGYLMPEFEILFMIWVLKNHPFPWEILSSDAFN